MKRLLLTLLLAPLISFSQEPITSGAEKPENFFGSDCTADTMSVEISPHDFCVLDANSYQLTRVKKGKTIWSADLNEFSGSDYMCMLVRPSSTLKKKEYIVFILAYTNERETARTRKIYSIPVR